MTTEINWVAQAARRWAGVDPLEQWVNSAPKGGKTPLAETIQEYLGQHNPFPDESRVDVLRREGGGWEPATVVERTAVDEWTVEFDDGGQVWRDHHELRPHSPEAD